MAGLSVDQRLDLHVVCAALERNTKRLASMMRDVTAPETSALGTWSIHDVGIHVTDGMENYAKRLRAQPASELDDIRKMPGWNVQTVLGLPRTPLPELADRLEAATADFVGAARTMNPDDPVAWYAGLTIPTVVAVSLRLIEHVLHGYDMAKAASRSWAIEPGDAVSMAYGLAYTSPHLVDPDRLDFEGAIEIRIRGEAPLFFIVRDRELSVQSFARSRIGFHISAEPVAWILVSTERMSRVWAGLTGRIIGWGSRPLLPFKLQAASNRT